MRVQQCFSKYLWELAILALELGFPLSPRTFVLRASPAPGLSGAGVAAAGNPCGMGDLVHLVAGVDQKIFGSDQHSGSPNFGTEQKRKSWSNTSAPFDDV
jgi:hypothetical protein